MIDDAPARWADGEAGQAAIKQRADVYRYDLLSILEQNAGAPWFLGERFSTIDLFVSVMSRWSPRRDWYKANSPKLYAIALAVDGPPGEEARQSLRDITGRMIEQVWSVDGSSEPTLGAAVIDVDGEFFTQLLSLAPANETQQLLKSQALQLAVDLARERQLLAAQHESRGLSVVYIVVVVIWLAVLFASFGLFARPNVVVVMALFLCAFSISAGIMLTLELDQPFGGLIKISSTPLEHVYENLGR